MAKPSEKFQRRYHAWRDSIDIEEEVTGRFAAVDGKSVPPKAKFALAVLDKLTPAGRTVVVVLALLVFAALAGLSLWRGGTGLGWW